MRAITQYEYGPPDRVLAIRDVATPRPGEGEVLVRVRAASVNAIDWHMVRGVPYVARLSFGPGAPTATVPGCDLAGTVAEVGPGVEGLVRGDEVFGCTYGAGCGAFAEYAAVPAGILAPRPAAVPAAEAAAIPLAGLTALQGLRDIGRVGPGQRVLIVGASGGVGTFAVQIAVSMGARVTGACSTRNVALVRSLGAEEVMDYTREDFTAGDQTYDVVLQVGGSRSPLACRKVLTPRGTLVSISGDSPGLVVGPLARMAGVYALSPFVRQRLRTLETSPDADDLRALTGLIEQGALRAVIDRTYPLDGVPAAIAHLEEGHPAGKVVIEV
jgi:NADPH:quinone reductase-like Zn-dependent oxidoreductase